jgi:hypothetical protein
MSKDQKLKGKDNIYNHLLEYKEGFRNFEADSNRLETRIVRLTECFLEFGGNPDENINGLVALCGELMGASCALYSRLEGYQLCSLGRWRTPPDFDLYIKLKESHVMT